MNAAILEYLGMVEKGERRYSKEQVALARHVRECFDNEEIYVDEELFDKYIKLEKYFPYENGLFPWEKFLIALWDCTFWKSDNTPRWKTLFCMVGRGAGKDAFIAFDAFCSVSPYNPVKRYNVDICANNEEQAVTPVKDIADVLEGKNEKKLLKFFYHTKQEVQGIHNRGEIKGRTNNPKGRDGMRSGKVVFNEVHAFQNYDNIKVFITGQGKVAHPRVGIFTSNGEINDGPLDDYIARSMRILFEGEQDRGFLPFICRLENKEQVHDRENWYMANPSLAYLPNLLKEIEDEYNDWLIHPEQNADFVTKRMGVRQTAQEIAVTEYDKLLATNKPIIDLTGQNCVVGIDYAEMSDWVGVNFHFRQGDNRYDINHAFVCTNSKTLTRVKAPWRDWAAKGLVTVVDDVSISPDLVCQYIGQMALKYNVRMIALDNFRWTLMSEGLRKIGFDASDRARVKLIRPSDIMIVEPVIQECFDRQLFSWGDNPCLRWAVNNTKRVRSSRKVGMDVGNFIYAKIEALSRKTDPFMALVASMVVEPALGNGRGAQLPEFGAYLF